MFLNKKEKMNEPIIEKKIGNIAKQLIPENLSISLSTDFEPILKKRVNPLYFLFYALLTIILIGSLLLWLPFAHNPEIKVSYINAIFTATSATTVTGLVVQDTLDTFNYFGQFIIFLMINLGGLGYMTIVTFFLLSKNAFGLKYAVFMKETLGLPSIGDILKIAKKVFLTIVLFEFIGILILIMIWADKGPISIWYAIFHSMSAFNNAGFDLMGNFKSLTAYASNFWLNFTIMALIFIGGIGFLVISDSLQVFRKEKRELTLHSKIVIISSIILILIGAAGVYTLEKNNSMKDYPASTKVLSSFFQSVSARTAGFNTIDLSKISTATIILLCLLMFIGASPGGTGGGIKTTTFAILILWVASAIKNKESPEVFNRRLNQETLQKALLMFFLSVMTILVAVFLVSIFETFSLQRIVFEVCSAFGTVGLTTGITPLLTSASKITLTILMFVGRITPLALLSLISKTTKDKTRVPEEQIAVG